MDWAFKVAATVFGFEGIRPTASESGIRIESLGEPDTGATVVECVTPLVPVENRGVLDQHRYVEHAFQTCIDALSELGNAYAKSTSDVRTQEPTRARTYPFPWSTRDPEEGAPWAGFGIFAANDGLQMIRTSPLTLDEEALRRVAEVLRDARQNNAYAVAAKSRHEKALTTLEVYWRYLTIRCWRERNRYPRTALTFLGEELNGKSLLDSRVVRGVFEADSGGDAWRDRYTQWVADVETGAKSLRPHTRLP